MANLDKFTQAYVVCALWSSTDFDGVPLERNFTIEDIAEEAIQQMISDCAKFQAEADHAKYVSNYPEQAGCDFWLTRNREGSGFLDPDRPWGDAGKRLADAAHGFGESYLYVGDDQKLYIYPS
jgi:hypothetical protein